MSNYSYLETFKIRCDITTYTLNRVLAIMFFDENMHRAYKFYIKNCFCTSFYRLIDFFITEKIILYANLNY